MASVSSNLPAVTRGLHALGDAFNLRRRLRGGARLGEEFLASGALAIEDRTVRRQEDPRNDPLPPLKERTIARKRRLGLDTRILIETHAMLDPENVAGRSYVRANEAGMAAGVGIEEQWKVEFAEEGGPGRPPRHFFDLGKDGVAAADAVADEAADDAIRAAEQA